MSDEPTMKDILEAIGGLTVAVQSVSDEVKAVKTELTDRIDGVEARLTGVEMRLNKRIESVRDELKADIDLVRLDLKQDIASAAKGHTAILNVVRADQVKIRHELEGKGLLDRLE